MEDKKISRTKPRFMNSFVRIWFQKFEQPFSDIRWHKWRYMLMFSLAPLFANMQESFVIRDPMFLHLDLMSWMGIGYCVGAGVLFSFASLNNIPRYARVLSSAAAVLFALWLFSPGGSAELITAFAFSFCFGGCAGIAAFGFTYALNNSERFLGAALTSLFCVLFQLDFSLGLMSALFSRMYQLGLVAVTLICQFNYKKEDYIESESKARSGGTVQIILMLYFFFAHKAVEVFYTYIEGASSPKALMTNGLVGIFIFGLSLYLYFRARFNLWHMCNLFFLGMFMAYLFRFLQNSESMQILSRIFHGFEQIGFIVSYTLLGAVMQKYAKFTLFKEVLITSLNASLLIYAIPGAIRGFRPQSQLLVGALVAFSLLLIFLLLAPAYANILFRRSVRPKHSPLELHPHPAPLMADRADDELLMRSVEKPQSEDTACIVRTDAPEGNQAIDETEEPLLPKGSDETEKPLLPKGSDESKQAALMKGKKLTAREREIMVLLLKGYLYKQCAIELGISIETIKFHASNAYRKLEVNGRNELFILFADERWLG